VKYFYLPFSIAPRTILFSIKLCFGIFEHVSNFREAKGKERDIYNGEQILYINIDQTLVNSFHGLLNCEIGGLYCHVMTTEYRTRVHCIYM